jgi:hypothetical protein
MTHAELLRIALSVHVAILAGSVVALYKYGDRTDVLAKSLAGMDSVLSKLRMIISDDLLATIKGCLSTVPTNPQLILGPDGRNPVYSEKVANFLESDTFRQTVRDFIDLRVDRISDYRILVRARDNWCFWARKLSWSILLLTILQVVFLVAHGIFDYLLAYSLPNWAIHATLAISGFMVLLVLCLPFPILLRSHDVILHYKVKYDAP